MTAERLSTLDASFLRLESRTAHMHVGWRGVFAVPAPRKRPTLSRLKETVAGRLRFAPRCRQRLIFAPAGLGEPYWVDDEDFHLDFHVRRLGDPYLPPSPARFGELCDQVLSRPLDRRRPLWEIHIAPKLADGRVGLVMKMHHAMVDGISAVQLALLVFSDRADDDAQLPDEWTPRRAPGSAGLALRAIGDSAAESLRAARGVAELATSPLSGTTRLAGTLRRTALAVGDDLLRAAPSAYVNREIGPARTLICHRWSLSELLQIKQRTQTTHNDVCLALVTGALRRLGGERDDSTATMKAMIPVSRRASERSGALGNRISFAFIDLPVGRSSPTAWLHSVHEQTQAFKRSERAAGTESLLSALRFTPAPIKTYAARLAASARTYNLTVSNVPGPRTPIYMLGAELQEAYPVVPLSDQHALSVGIFTYREGVHLGLYVDPEALPEATALPMVLRESARALNRATLSAARVSHDAGVPHRRVARRSRSADVVRLQP